ncbi:hypothetical protein BGZ96_000320 [Linnemannia gamsii]|uniref:Methyltransferase domain-containing protein n=1 Tax=Linnemannia gamsii TaxID=64522 RepID=A0ABQ7JPB6_9FUNG|nr:hypothetical protein BGZ96_000320 [Linnemannia gamsii]
MTATTVRDLTRGLLRPRFLIAAFIVTALVTMGVHRGRLVNNVHLKMAPEELSKKIYSSERIYQKQVQKRKRYIRQNNANEGAWMPEAKEMMPFWWYFQPSFNCPYEIERVGRFNDGGKWMCGMTLLESMTKEDGCVIYSLGVFDDSSWEKEMIDRTKCQVYAFDASVNGIAGDAAGNPNIHFSKYFIGGEDKVDEDGHTWKTLKTIMQENGHTWIDVLKIDIEGNEFDALNAMMDQFDVLPFSQLQLEIHAHDNMVDVEKFNKFLTFWERLESKNLRPFWSELNMIYTRLYKELGLSEYSFINIGGRHKFLQNL